MDAMAYMFSVARENSSSVLEFKPECIMEEDLMSLSSKFPLIPGSQRSIAFCTTMLSQKLREMPSDADFDLTDPYNTLPRYNVLHDPHLKEYFQSPTMRKRLIEKGFIMPSGLVKCTLLEFNMFRQWIRKLKLDRLHQEHRRQRQFEKQQWKEKQAREQLLRDEELYSILREREQKARELKERGIKRREVDRRKYFKLQELDRKRREQFEDDLKRKKDQNERQREKALAKRQAEKVEEDEKVKKINFRLRVKRSSEDKRRESLLQNRRQTLNEEKEKKLRESWKRRCSLSLERQEEKRRKEEKEREEHIRNVARRTSIVQQQRRKSRDYHDLCLQRRRDSLEKQHQEAEDFLEKMREKKMKDLELWKQKHQRMRERHLQQGHRGSLRSRPSDVGPEHRRRSRLSSVWDLQSSLKNEFGIDDNVVYSGVVFAGRKAKQRARQLEALAEEQTSRQIEEVDEFEKLLSRLEAEFALRERVHYVAFGIISNAQHALDIQERLEIGKEVPGYVQRIVDNAQRILGDEESSGVLLSLDEQRRRAAQEIVATAISNAREEYKRRASLRDTAREIVTSAIDSAFQRALRDGQDLGPKKETVAENISENLFECAKDVVTVAVMSACRHSRGDREISAAKSLAADAVLAAKASLEKLYGTTCELDAKDQVDTHEISSSLDICAKEVAAAAIISATRSLERTYFKHDSNVMAARSLALDAVAAAKASLENFLGVIVEFEEEDVAPSTDILACLAESAKDVAEGVLTSSSQFLSPTKIISKTESRVAQSLANDAIQAAVASIQNLYGIKVDFEDESEEAVIGIAATAIISATQSMEKDSKKRDFDLTIAARELANSAMDSAKASIGWFQRESVAPGSKEDALRIFSSLDEAVKRIAEVAVESATRSLQRMAEENERDLTYTTRELVTNVLNSTKASIERLYGIKIEPEIELLPPSKEISIMSSASESFEQILDVKEREVELMVAARNLASNALQAAEASLQRLYCIANEIESNIENAALDISKSLVDSSPNLHQRLDKEGLGTAARELACRAIESASKSIAKPHGDESSLQQKVESDSCLLKAAAKVTTISARASSGELFDRGFIGGSELEEATGHMASHAVRSAEALLAQVQESSSTVDLDLQICKAAFELASQVVVSAENCVARSVQQNQSVPSYPGSDHGQLFWKVSTCVEGLINGALRRLGSVGYFNDDTDDLEDYELISHSEALQADAEYSPLVQDLFQREKLSLKASRIVNDFVENAKEIVKTQMKNTSFFFAPDVKPGHTRFTRRRSSSVHFNEGSLFHSRRDSHVPRETDFLSVVNRPPTPRFRKARAQPILQELQEVDKELCSPSDSDLNILKVTDSDHVQRRVSDPGQGINCENVSVPERERSASDSKLFVQNQSSTVTEKPSLYDIIKKREECASCEISPCGSYVVLPHLNPSECSLIAARVESYEVLWKQKKSITSVTSLPSLSPKGSFVAGEGVQHVSQHEESHNRTIPSSSRLPNITNSTSKICQRSSSESSLKQSSGQPKRTSSLQIRKSSKPSPQSSKQSAKFPCKPSARKGSLSKIATSRESLPTKDESGHSSSRSKIALTQKSLVKDKHSNISSATRNESGSSLTRASSPRPSTEVAVISSLAMKGKVSNSPRASIIKAVFSPRSSREKVSQSQSMSPDNVGLASQFSINDIMPSPRTSTVKAPLSKSHSGGKVAQSPNTSAQDNEENREVCPRASTETTLTFPKDLEIDVGPQGVEVSTSNAVAVLAQTVAKTSCQSASSLDLQQTTKKATKSEMVLKGSAPSGERLRKELSCSAKELEKASENVEKCLTSLPPTFLRKHQSKPEGVGSQLDRTDGDSVDDKESEMIKSMKNVVPSLERIIQDKRLTPEGAEAETRPASSADILAARKTVDPQGIRGNTVQQVISRSARPSLSKSLSSAAKSSLVGVMMNQQGSRSSQEVTVSKPSDEDKAVTTRKKPEGEDTNEVPDVSSGAVGESSDKSSKMFVSSSAEIVSFPGTNKELVPARTDVIKVEGYPTYRNVSISRSIHDTVDDIVQQMLRTTDEPTAAEGTGSRKEIKKDTEGNLGASSMFDQQRKFPSGKFSKTVIDTVDLMLRSVSASDERKPRYSFGRKISGSDIVSGIDIPRTTPSMERFAKITSSSPQVVSCVYELSPSPPKLPSPKVSRLRATSSQASIGIRATQSDSSIVSSSSDKAADLKPKVSGAWLDDRGNSSRRSQSPTRPQSSPSPSLHRRSSDKLSVRHSLKGVSMETHDTLRKHSP